MLCRRQLFLCSFQRKIVSLSQFINSFLADIKSDDRTFTTKFDGQWQTYIPKADHGQLDVLQLHVFSYKLK